MAKVIMIQGTMSNAGKSVLVAGLCRILKQDGKKVAPFKSQNMALNSFITKDGLEMGRAQVMQAEAAGIEPDVRMNPILLKPTNEMGSQVIVNGEVRGNMTARDYFAHKKDLIPDIMKAFGELSDEYDYIVIEGAGSPAEINLKQDDIVNMGLAKMVQAPVLLVGDIDRGGVFAQLYGTIALLEDEERDLIKGLVINKFRGDKTILDPGIDMLEDKCNKKVCGVIPYMNVQLEDEDSLSEKLISKAQSASALIDIAVIRFPRISNFTDFDILMQFPGVCLRYIESAEELGNPDMVILPGSKNTMRDLMWMRQNGIEARLHRLRDQGCVIFGICGGYQMLGENILDPNCSEEGGSIKGIGFLPMNTNFEEEKTRTRVHGTIKNIGGILAPLQGTTIEGYEIHMGTAEYTQKDSIAMNQISNQLSGEDKLDGLSKDNVYGTYIHGFFDQGEIAAGIIKCLADKKGVILEDAKAFDYKAFKETQYDILAETIRKHMNMEEVYRILEEGV